MHKRCAAAKYHRYHGVMIACSICSHSDWCDGGDTCDCRCHEVFESELGDVEDDLNEDDEEIEYEED
jgi:hypothetical protein